MLIRMRNKKWVRVDGLVKSPSTALRCIFSHCDLLVSRPHSCKFARLVAGAFSKTVQILTFYRAVRVDAPEKCPQGLEQRA